MSVSRCSTDTDILLYDTDGSILFKGYDMIHNLTGLELDRH